MKKQNEYKKIKDKTILEYDDVPNRSLVKIHMSTMNGYKREDISLEMNRRLIEEIEDFNKSSSEEARDMINLTKWIKWLTIVLGIMMIFQIIVTFTQ